MLPYEFLLEQNGNALSAQTAVVLLPYEFLLEQNFDGEFIVSWLVLLPYEFLLEQNYVKATDEEANGFVTI